MASPTELMRVVAFTRSDELSTFDKTIRLPYQRVVALWHNDGFFGQHIGERDTRGRDQKVLTISPVVGSRLMSIFSAITERQSVNCHRFGREMTGMESSTNEPVLDFESLPVVDLLPKGSMGVIGVKGYGVPHTIGYGLGDESLQVMSGDGELGFAKNAQVIDFYRRIYPNRIVNLHQA